MTNPRHGAFWDDLAHDLEDEAFARRYAIESARIATIDAVVNSLDEAREVEGLSKADLARAVGADPAVIRRLFGSRRVNPTLGTLAEIATALGLRITVEKAPAGYPGAVPACETSQPAVMRSAGAARVAASKGRPTAGKKATHTAAKAGAKSKTKGKWVAR